MWQQSPLAALITARVPRRNYAAAAAPIAARFAAGAGAGAVGGDVALGCRNVVGRRLVTD